MKKIKILWGTLAMVLVFGLAVVSCGKEEEEPASGHDTALVAKWGVSASSPTVMFEFQSDGKFVAGGETAAFTWSSSGGKFTFSTSGVAIGSADYAVSGTELTISNAAAAIGIENGKYYKK